MRKLATLNPYRFSDDELKLLSNLKEVFSANGFAINLWPEIYFCVYDEAVLYFDLNKGDEHWSRDENYLFNPDYLGVYLPLVNKEGVIVLFRDRIQEAAVRFYRRRQDSFKDFDIVINLMKTKVLIHEIGHWLTHACSMVNQQEVMLHFNLLPKIIKETMAQLTVIWSYYKHKSAFEYSLENFARIFMPLQPYPYYEFSKLSHIYSPEIMLRRYWGLVSQPTHLNETSMFELLSKREIDLTDLQKATLAGKSI